MLEKKDSAHSMMPALAAMAGLSTHPLLMYKMIGVDILHVSYRGELSLPSFCSAPHRPQLGWVVEWRGKLTFSATCSSSLSLAFVVPSTHLPDTVCFAAVCIVSHVARPHLPPPLFHAGTRPGHHSHARAPACASFLSCLQGPHPRERYYWSNTPYGDAVTAVCSEHAVIYARIARWTTVNTPPPMTLSEAASLQIFSAEFI